MANVPIIFIVSILFSFNLRAQNSDLKARKDSLSRVGHHIIDLTPVGLFIIDGLKLSKSKYDSIGIDFIKMKKIKIKGIEPSLCYSQFGEIGKDGAFVITTPFLIIINGKEFSTKYKKKRLSALEEGKVRNIKFLNPKEYLKEFGKIEKYGALVVSLK